MKLPSYQNPTPDYRIHHIVSHTVSTCRVTKIAEYPRCRCAGVETETVSSEGAFGSQEAPEKTNSYYVNSWQNLTNPCNAAEYVQGNGIFLQAASATVNCSQPEERPKRARGRENHEERTTEGPREMTRERRERSTQQRLVWFSLWCYLLYFVKMFYYYFVMSEVVQRVFWLWKKCVREEEY